MFRLSFSYFAGEAEIRVIPIFFLFRAGGPKSPFQQAGRVLILLCSEFTTHSDSLLKI